MPKNKKKNVKYGGCFILQVFDKITEEALDYSDEVKYPEAYRKTDYVKGCNETTPQPFDVGIIVDVFTPMGSFSVQNLRLKVRSLYRPYQVGEALSGGQKNAYLLIFDIPSG